MSRADNTVVMVDYKRNAMLNEYGVSCHWWASGATSLHRHNFYEFFTVTEGSAVHELNGGVSGLKKGTVYMIRPDDVHRIIPDEKDGCVHLNLCVTPEKLTALCSALGISLEDLLAADIHGTALSADEQREFMRVAQRLNRLYYSGDPGCAILVCELIMRAVAMIGHKVYFESDDSPEWFYDLLDKINSPEYIDCSAKDVYALAGFSAPMTVEFFKKHTGKTVCAYLREQKMLRACEILQNTDISVLEISNMLGYTSLSHFNRIFSGFAGVTPAAYRKRAKQL